MAEISEKEFNIAELQKILDPDFAKLRTDYYLYTKEVTPEEEVLYSRRRVVVSNGEWGGMILYYCISNEVVIYVGNNIDYGDFWFLKEII